MLLQTKMTIILLYVFGKLLLLEHLIVTNSQKIVEKRVI